MLFTRRDALRSLAAAFAAPTLTGCVTAPDEAPSNKRNWDEFHQRLSTVSWTTSNVFALSNVRDWRWNEQGATGKHWRSVSYDVRNARALWYFIEPFAALQSLAHTYITFELERGGRREFLSLSVEARREVGETYSPLRGLAKGYELIFAWSSEKDILTDTIIRLDQEVRGYRVNVTPGQTAVILRGFLERTNQIARTPEFYHTFEHNCTSELAEVVNRKFDMPIPRSSAFVLTGNAARYLHSLGYIGDPKAPFAEVDANADLRDVVRRYRNLPEHRFSVAWRQALAAA